MKLYKYKFDRILSYRESIERNQKMHLSLSIKRYIKEKNKLLNLNADLNKNFDDFRNSIAKGMTIGELLKIEENQNYLKEVIKKKTIDVKNADNDVKENRVKLIKAMQDRKVLERLKEIDLLNYNYELQKETEKDLDEIIGFKHNRP
ncbi:MAG: flagellar export protein FliJ [Firmicutes bacterium]|nr:flagellar export protein FliJ [Bacillota bacterium]